MQFKNEFELPSSDSDYENDCPSEENFLDKEERSPKLANVNLLSSKLENEVEMNAELETLQSKDESFPSGLAPLEELFDFNDVARKPKLEPVETEVEE